ncbi:txe/YoeB family addiction module toxin [Clostridia bacterium]|nr:txe/YoeB family addiction module toxin [Clostridia bacterium]
MRIAFTENALNEYFVWQREDRKTLTKINRLIVSIQRDGLLNGIGKPEKLKYNKDLYSRRIDEKNRLVYRQITDDLMEILSCEGHYEE